MPNELPFDPVSLSRRQLTLAYLVDLHRALTNGDLVVARPLLNRLASLIVAELGE